MLDKRKCLAWFDKHVVLFPRTLHAPPGLTDMRIITYNVFMFKRSSIFSILSSLAMRRPDVICLQEIVENCVPTIRRMAASFGFMCSRVVGKGNACLMTLTKTCLVRWKRIGDFALCAHVYKGNSLRASIVNVHLDVHDLSGHTRLRQMQAILATTQINDKLIIVGDFNAVHPNYQSKKSWKAIKKHDRNDRQIKTPTLLFDYLHMRGLKSHHTNTRFTCWSNRIVDHAVAKKRLVLQCVPSTKSDHVPLCVDVF